MLDQPTIRLYPIPMSQFGLNPYGEPMYRIVFAESRYQMIGGEWLDGSIEYRFAPMYDYIKRPWILERWHSPREFCQGMTEAQWDLKYRQPCGLLLQGPYPRRGEYFHVHTFTSAVEDASLEKLVAWIEEGRKRSFQEISDANRKAYDDDTAARRAQSDAIIRNAMPSWLDRPFVAGTGVKRGTKTRSIVKSANELGLPIGQNKFINFRESRV